MSRQLFLLFVVLHAAVGYVFLAETGPGFPLDDTWLHMVYARSFGEGRGFSYNPGQHETGVTAPVWTAMLAAPVALSDAVGRHPEVLAALPGMMPGNPLEYDGRPDLSVRLLGGIMGLLLAVTGYRLASRAGRWPAIFAGLALTFDPLLVFDRFSGTELALFGLLSLLLMETLVDKQETRAGWLCGLIALTRPEGLLLAVLSLAYFARYRLRVTRFLGPVLLCILPWMAYCLLVSGRPWPATFDTKAMAVFEPRTVFTAVSALFGGTGWGWALPLAVMVGVYSLEGGRHSLGVLPCAGALLLIGGVLVSRPMEVAGEPARMPYYWARYAHIAWPLLIALASAGLSSVVRTAFAGTLCRPSYAVVLIGPCVLLLYLGWDMGDHAQATRQQFAAECRDIETLHVAAGRWVEHHTPPEAVVATHDAGAVRFFGNRKVVDIFGNSNHELLARERESPEAAQQWLLRQAPDALVVFPALWARNHSPELASLWAELPPQEGAALLDTAVDYAEFFGLTRRATTFHVDAPATVPSPLHADLAIFVAP